MKHFSTTGIYVHEQLQLGLRFCFLRNDSGVLRIANRILETRLYNLFTFEGPRLYTSTTQQLLMALAKVQHFSELISLCFPWLGRQRVLGAVEEIVSYA